MNDSGKETFVVLALAATLFAVALWGVREESRSFLLKIAPLPDRVAAVVAMGKRSQALSWLASDEARAESLDTCLTTLKSTLRAYEASPALADLNRGCLNLAEDMVALAPMNANAWYVAASEAERLGDDRRMREYLRASFRAGPNEEWIAERRALFGYEVRERLDADLRRAVDGDFALLLRTTTGVQLLADRYVADEEIRGLLTDIAGRLDPKTQHDFLEYVKGAYYRRDDNTN